MTRTVAEARPGTGAAPTIALKAIVSAAQEETERGLFEVRRKIYPRAVSGWFATWRWALVWFTQILFYGLPWVAWNDRQAVLFDLGARKFYIFGLVFWPQDFIYLTLLLVAAAVSLFLFTAVAGRLWCGYACPQTVYTEIFLWIERVIEGEPNARTKLDAAPLTARKFWLKAAKHGTWAALAFWTGFTFVGYFSPVKVLGGDVLSFSLGPWETFWIFFYGFATYGNAGWMREQVCMYMCPYARFQGAMFDQDTLIIAYDGGRGDPRGSRSKKADPKALGLGDCVDCGICVQVCPTGIDIREGLQYECIGCAACIDGCDKVMEKMGYPKGLIRYSTEHALQERSDLAGILKRFFRPRTLVYTTILATVVVAAAAALFVRVPLKVDVIRDRGAMVREVGDGELENVYRLQVMNATESARRFRITVEGLHGVRVASEPVVEMAAASTRAFPVRIRLSEEHAKGGSQKFWITVAAEDGSGIQVREKAVFLSPHKDKDEH
ncbi:MAG TPA: cytochrome c oxidase accessory protein CcoG [Usitatibacteraceae bacterium]|nr:cytochrome c oxidase accessory protein CcoG [Usitatibacteraceae bacterium]